MRELLRVHRPAFAGFAAMCMVAGSFAVLFPVPSGGAFDGQAPLPVEAIPLPDPQSDADLDSYADAVDLADGDLLIALELRSLRVEGSDPEPYVVAGTQDDQWRTGLGAELEWRHVVDYDALGRKAGSPSWQENVLRTGAWWVTEPGDGLDLALARASRLAPGDVPAGATWPQVLHLNARDDRETLRVQVELRDAATRPHRAVGAWDLEYRMLDGAARLAGGEWAAAGTTLRLGDLEGPEGRGGLEVALRATTDLDLDVKEGIAERWAPILRFDSGEAFYPVPGDALREFHGFARPTPRLGTWGLSFNDGRDTYRLFVGDFNGDRRTDHEDAVVMTDLLSAGGIAPPTVYAHVTQTTNGQVAVQYWFLYFYNFVLDEEDRDIQALVHSGDREFVQLLFADAEAARRGAPLSIAYSQHYGGLALGGLDPDAAPFEDGHPLVHPARGSHASYPAPGDDRRLRPAFSGYFDRFDGGGAEWRPGTYTVEVLGAQAWHMGYLWGPVTRYGRDLGTSTRPLLQHDFRHPFTDPVWWQASLTHTTPDQLEDLYGRPPE